MQRTREAAIGRERASEGPRHGLAQVGMLHPETSRRRTLSGPLPSGRGYSRSEASGGEGPVNRLSGQQRLDVPGDLRGERHHDLVGRDRLDER